MVMDWVVDVVVALLQFFLSEQLLCRCSASYDDVSSAASSSKKRGHAAAEARMLKKVEWLRVILDESQCLHNSRSVVTQTASELTRTYSWLLSGTPAANAVHDLVGQLVFLGVEPWCRLGPRVHSFWDNEIEARWNKQDPDILDTVHTLLAHIMMRHSKTQASWRGKRRLYLWVLAKKTSLLTLFFYLQDGQRPTHLGAAAATRGDAMGAVRAPQRGARVFAVGSNSEGTGGKASPRQPWSPETRRPPCHAAVVCGGGLLCCCDFFTPAPQHALQSNGLLLASIGHVAAALAPDTVAHDGSSTPRQAGGPSQQHHPAFRSAD